MGNFSTYLGGREFWLLGHERGRASALYEEVRPTAFSSLEASNLNKAVAQWQPWPNGKENVPVGTAENGSRCREARTGSAVEKPSHGTPLRALACGGI